ncbi:RiPP maturation radical SAM C-methyltransferase [Tengunoibacter tsumagoiensis]|uniref:RiPP maturation radical SAM protein 1 n=1 Tax=Tengunoibacter tsumagoiensis TaxID=2014871 RepID=A0A402A690_9CHLR|nr:RiPP maturation radical SAM C-methyltransferase [Tengunoibacter tsumagoiensis]GCE14654.1 RiPP maturation radical SAM protein 1 [Tengunoibacter tsumagoiensis]
MLSMPSHTPSPQGDSRQTPVLLISMPFGLLDYPSLALGLLQGSLQPLQIPTSTLYFTFKFAEMVGSIFYQQIAKGRPMIQDFIGEWIFSAALFAENSETEAYIRNVVYGDMECHNTIYKTGKGITEDFIQDILAARAKTELFLSECVEEILQHNPAIVGFTSVFQQHVASLALAKRIKARSPETCIMMGGANCEGIMGVELIKQFSFVDVVVSGEGDQIFPDLVKRILAGQSISHLQGVYTRRNVQLLTAGKSIMNTPSIRNLDALPFPLFDDFFEQLSRTSIRQTITPGITFETSRGCWWGEKHHCTFCGLNGSTMTYRSKTAQRAMEELLYLTNSYPDCAISVVDNILDMKYFKDFIPSLAALPGNLRLYYEVKANLRKEQVKSLREAGILMIQPGIESLSNHVLDLMRKGVKGLQNIQLLKWCKEYEVDVTWNLLCGFPGEDPAEYRHMGEILPLLTHLRPPSGIAPIRLDRFSPNYDEAKEHGFYNVRAYPSYQYIYPFSPEIINNLAYFFIYDYADERDVASYTLPIAQFMVMWHQQHRKSQLFFLDYQEYLMIWDLRPVATEALVILTGLQRSLYIFCDTIRNHHHLQQFVTEHATPEEEGKPFEEFLEPLIQKGLMLQDGHSYLSLAVQRRRESERLTQPAVKQLQA